MNPGSPEGLDEEVRVLRARVQRLEDALSRQGILAPNWPSPPSQTSPHVEPPAPMPVQPVVAQPVVASAPMFAASRAPESKPQQSLESRIGSQWFNRIGILAVLIGMAWFLKLAVDNHWIGPLGRVLIGLVAGAGLIVWSEHFRARGFLVFSYSLKSVGSGVLYLSLWAAFSLFHLIPGGVAFAAMIAVTAFNGYLSWIQDSELLAVYAIAGGFGTPLLVSTGENHEVALFSYMLLLDLVVLALVVARPYSRLLFGAFAGTVFYAAGWSFQYYSTKQAWTTAFFFACFFVIFALAPRLSRIDPVTPEGDVARGTTGWDKLATVLLPVLNAGLGFLAFYLLLDSSGTEWAEPWIAVLFAGFYLVLLRLPASGWWRPSPYLLTELHLACAVVFLTLAIPLKASGRWITIGWLAEGAALLWVAQRTRSGLLRALALICLVLAVGALLVVNPSSTLTPVFNQRFATYLAAIAAFGFVAWLAHRAPENAEFDRAWKPIAAAAVLTINALILVAVSNEIHTYWSRTGWRQGYQEYALYHMYAQFSYSAFFMLFGASLLALGFSRNSSFLRWQALVLLAVSIGKVFLVDVSALSQGYRILSFLGLGALLLGVSFVYQRDWLHLRSHEDKVS